MKKPRQKGEVSNSFSEIPISGLPSYLCLAERWHLNRQLTHQYSYPAGGRVSRSVGHFAIRTILLLLFVMIKHLGGLCGTTSLFSIDRAGTDIRGANTFGVKYTIVDDLLGKSECETKCKSCQSWISKSIYKFHRSNLAYRPVNVSFND